MKNRIKLLTLCLLCMALLFPLTSCTERYDLLYSEEHDGITYCVRGTGNTAKQVVVKEGDKVLWYQGVKIDGSVGNLNGNYGFSVYY